MGTFALGIKLPHDLALQTWGTVLSASLLAYGIFKRYEPEKPIYLIILLLASPSLQVFMMFSNFASTQQAIAFVFPVYYGTIMLLVTGYRLSPLHPLAKYPGTISDRLSRFWMVWVASSGKRHLYYQRLHEIYGDVVRTGPNELSICDARAIQDVLGTPGLPKGAVWESRHPPGDIVSLIAIRDPVEHAQRRKPWAQAFNSTGLKIFEPIIVDKVQDLVEHLILEGNSKNEVDLAMWMRAFSFDFMGNMAFDTDFGFMKKGGDTGDIWAVFALSLKAIAISTHITWALPTIFSIIPKSSLNYLGYALAKKWVAERAQRGSKIKDLFYYLMAEEDDESQRPRLDTIESEGILAVIAGSDTTSTTLTTLFYHLLSNTEKLSKLRAEVDKNFTREEEPVNFTTLAGMEYLNACINEALRICPPVPGGSQRHIPPGSGGRMIGSRLIPEGTSILIHTFTILRNSRYFSHPESFVPERWLADARPADFVHTPDAFVPFSFGPQGCVGKSLAMMSLRAVTVSIVQRLDVTMVGGLRREQWEDGIKDWFAVTVPPLHVRLQAR